MSNGKFQHSLILLAFKIAHIIGDIGKVFVVSTIKLKVDISVYIVLFKTVYYAVLKTVKSYDYSMHNTEYQGDLK